MTLAEAMQLGSEVLSGIRPYCARCAIAGSTRRLKPDGIKDVEIVAIPDVAGLYHLPRVVNHYWGPPVLGVFPSRYTKIRGRYSIDFWWQTKDTFGLNFFIRSAEFVESALARWKRLTVGGYSEKAQLHLANGLVHPTPDEASVFRALQLDYIPPELRNEKLKD